MPEDHPDNNYDYLSRTIDKLIAEDRKRRNTESLVLDASGQEQKLPKKQPGAPGRRKKGDGQGGDADPPVKPGAPGVLGDGGGKGKGKGKGKEKGKNKGGERDAASQQAQDSGYESSGSDRSTRKRVADFPGKAPKDLPEDQRCCAHFLWVRPDGTSFCKKFNKGVECHARHLPPSKCPKAMKGTNTWAAMRARHGEMNCPEAGPKKPVKKE